MKKIIPFILVLLIVFGLFSLYQSKKEIKNPSLDEKLINLGYSKSDIKIIQTLNNPNIILNYDYNSNIIEMIQNNDFKEENLEKYIEFSSQVEFNIDDIIYIINHNYYDKNIEYTEKVISLMKQDYFIYDHLDRYLNYKTATIEFIDEESELKYIIQMVNSNRDYEYYTNVVNTDLSKEFLIIVNKYHKLDQNYVPNNLINIESKYGREGKLNQTVYEAYKKLFEDASKEGMNLYIRSPYRSYNTQSGLYENYARQDGYSEADTYSARPGYSEHQTGLAFDVTSKTTTLGTFEGTKEFNWMMENAYKYGFILRYPKGKENITGYIYEPWHYRYVGEEVAKFIFDNDITFEEYYEYYVK